MQFIHNERTFETAGMAAFPTGVAAMPMIYVNDERICFLKQWRKKWDAPRVKLLLRREALRYADLYGMADLRRILSVIPAVEGRDNLLIGLATFRIKLQQKQARSPDAPEDMARMALAIDSSCRAESEKIAAARWLHPFSS